MNLSFTPLLLANYLNVSKYFQSSWDGVFLHMAMPSATCTRICQVLLAEEAALTFGSREAAYVYSMWLLSWARHFLMNTVGRNMSSRLKGWKGLRKEVTIKQNLCLSPRQPGEMPGKAEARILIQVSYCNFTQPACSSLPVPVSAAGLTCLCHPPTVARKAR